MKKIYYNDNNVGLINLTSEGGGGITSGEVQTMIDNSISGKADSDDVYTTGQTSGATELATAFAATQPKLSAGTGIDITDNVISVTGGGSVTIDSSFDRNSENAISNKVVSRGTIGSYGLTSEGSGANLRNIIQAYDQGGYGISNKNLVYTNINNKPVISIYSNKYNVPYNIEVVETSAITTAVTSSSTDSEIPSAKAVYDIVGNIETLLSQI